MKKKIVIVANDIAMPGEKGLSRLLYLAKLFVKNGFDTEIVTADFQHWEKRYRTESDIKNIRSKINCKVTFIHEGAYAKNIDLRRILSYRTLSRNMEKYLESNSYDLVYALIPDNHLAHVAGKYAKKHGLPFIIDVEDLWPEAMRMVFDIPVISDVLFSYFTVNAKKAYKLADAVVGSSDEYRGVPLKYGVKVPESVTVYVGNDLRSFDAGVQANIGKIKKPENEFWITYAGTLGTSYDIHTLIQAADILKKRNINNIKTVILGDGPLRSEFEAAAANSDADIFFAGYLPAELMAAYLSCSDVTVNSLVSKASQSIVSKIGDYLAAGKPMINTGLNTEFKNKVIADGFGVNVEPQDPRALADAVYALYSDPEKCARMGEIARRTAELQFNRAVSYMEIIRLAEKLLKKYGETNETL